MKCSVADCDSEALWEDGLNKMPTGGKVWCGEHAMIYRTPASLVPLFLDRPPTLDLDDLFRQFHAIKQEREKESKLDFTMSRLPVVDGKIVIEMNRQSELLHRWEVDTFDTLTREALITMGWTPPESKEGRLEGLKYALQVVEGRRVLSRTPSYLAALDEIKIFLDAAIERTENGEEMHSTATIQNEP